MAVYSLSYNTSDNADFQFAGKLDDILTKWNQCSLHIITHEHIDRSDAKKDHLQIAFTLDTSLAPSAVNVHLKRNGLKADFNRPAYLLKKHKGDTRFAYGYCQKEVPETGKVLFTNLDPKYAKECLDFYLAQNKSETLVVPIVDQWIEYALKWDWSPNDKRTCLWVHDVPQNFDHCYEDFIADTDCFPTFSQRNQFKYNFQGLRRRRDRE